MHIGLLTACYEPTINGVTRMVSLYQQALTTAGHTATIFTLGHTNHHQTHVLRAPAVPIGHTGYHTTPRLPRAMQAKLAEMDVLHAHHLFMSLAFARRYARPGTPILYTNHTRYDLYTAAYLRHFLPQLPSATADKIARHVMRIFWPRQTALADVVIAPTTAVGHTMRDFGVQTPITVIPNGIDLAPFQQAAPLPRTAHGLPTATPLAVYVGRLASEKNLGQLFTAVEIACHQFNTPLHLWLIGDGPQRPELERRAATPSLRPHITFAGAIPNSAVPSYLATADFFVTPSLSEVHPLTAIEAQATGLPIVAYENPSLDDLVTHGQNGLLSPPNDPTQLAHHLHQLATNATLRRHLSATARAHSQQFDIARTVQQTIALYDEMLVG